MATSRNPEYMKAFGKVMTDMFNWYAENKREAAEEWLMKLEAIKWKNYLTKAEAEDIVAKMQPKAPWSRDVWKSAMESYGLPLEKEPCYNSCALWTEMNKQYSDSAETIASILGKDLKDVPADQMVKATYHLALDMLTDKDGVYNIRKYFGL